MCAHADRCELVAFNIEYRLCPEANSTKMATDVVMVLKYILDNAKELGLDATKIGLYGHGGGGYAVSAACGMLAANAESGLVKLAFLV